MSVSEKRAKALFRLDADDPAQPWMTEWWCGPRCNLAMGRSIEQGVSLEDVGQIMLWSPPAFLYENNPTTQPMMFCAPSLNPQFSAGQDVKAGDYLFRSHERDGRAWVEIVNSDGSPIRDPASKKNEVIEYRQAINATRSSFNNHIAKTIAVETAKGIRIQIFDPHLADRPLTPKAWKKAQNCDAAVLMHAGRDGVLRLIPQDAGGRATIEAITRNKGINDPYGKGQPDLIAAITGFGNGNKNRIGNPYDPPRIQDATGQPSLQATIAYYEAWLKPLRALQSEVMRPLSSHDPRAALRERQQTALTADAK